MSFVLLFVRLGVSGFLLGRGFFRSIVISKFFFNVFSVFFEVVFNCLVFRLVKKE